MSTCSTEPLIKVFVVFVHSISFYSAKRVMRIIRFKYFNDITTDEYLLTRVVKLLLLSSCNRSRTNICNCAPYDNNWFTYLYNI